MTGTIEDAYKTLSTAVEAEREFFGEICVQAMVARNCGDEDWEQRLLLTGRTYAIGGPLEPDCLGMTVEEPI